MISKRVLLLSLTLALVASVASAQIVVTQEVLVNTLQIGSGGTLDITSGNAVVLNGDYGILKAQVVNSFENGGNYDWAGTGITSSNAAARAQIDGMTAVSIVSNDNMGLTEFGLATGLLGTSNEILMNYTWVGDTDLDGVLTPSDYFTLLLGYDMGTGGWEVGDTDYDGAITPTDYFTFLAAWDTPGSQSGPPTAAAAGAAVPEPSCLVLLVVAGLLVAGYKKFK
jgi:hypothetical protein